MLLSDLSVYSRLRILKVVGPGFLQADPAEEAGEGSMLFSSEEFGAQAWAFCIDWGELTDLSCRQWLEKSLRATQGEVEELVGYSPMRGERPARLLYWGDTPEKMLGAFSDEDFRVSTLCGKTLLVS